MNATEISNSQDNTISKTGHHFIIVKNGSYKLELYLAVTTYKVDIFCEANTEILNYILRKMLQNP